MDTERRLMLTVSDELLLELGRIVVFQVHIESMLGHYIMELMGVDTRTGQILTAELSFKNQIAIISSLLIDRLGESSPLYIEFKDIKRSLYEFENFRNTVAHSVWAHGESFDSTVAIRIKITSKEARGLKYQHEQCQVHDLVDALEKASDTQVKLASLIAKVTDVKIPKIIMHSSEAT